MMKTYKIWSVIAVALMGSAVVAETSVWQGGATATTPIVAANWNDPANWDVNGVPNGSDDQANFGTVSDVFYVTSAVPISLCHCLAQNAAGLVYVSDQVFALCNSAQVNSYCGHVYAPFDFKNPASELSYVSQSRFCDTMKSSVGSALLNGRSYFHLDRFAHVVGEDREENFQIVLYAYQASADFYAPESSATNVTCTFDQTAGSAFLKRVGGSVATIFPVGTMVSGEGVPYGTYLKRVFPYKDWVELSQPVTVSAGANELTFAAFTPNLTLKLNGFTPNDAVGANRFRPCKYRLEDRFVVDVQSFGLRTPVGDDTRAIVFDVPFGRYLTDQAVVTAYFEACIDIPYETPVYPATIVIHGSGSAQYGDVRLAQCDLLFSDNPDNDRVPGFANGRVSQLLMTDRKDANGKLYPFTESKLSVTGSMTAVIHELSGVHATLAKCGTGTLLVGMTNSVPSTGTIAVREGTFAIAEPDNGYSAVASEDPVEIGSLEVAAGATFVVPSRGVRVTTSHKIDSGATIAGEGVLMLPSGIDLSAVNFVGNARLGVLGVQLVGTPEHSYVTGNPAFWVDCSQTNTMTLAKTNDQWGVLRIDDVRMHADGYNITINPDNYVFSTNASGEAFMPRLYFDDVSRKHFVYFLGNDRVMSYAADVADATKSDTHFWTREIGPIKAVFQVMSTLRQGENEKGYYKLTSFDRGGGFLGHYKSYNVWGRYTTAYTAPFTQDTWDAAGMVKNGRWYVNGSKYSGGHSAGYPYVSYISDDATLRLVPETIVYQPPIGSTSFAVAGSYEHSVAYQTQNKNGNKILCELIVYTNDVTDAERVMITSYLMKKWQNAEVVAKDFQSDGGSLGSLGGSSRFPIDTEGGDGVLVDEVKEAVTLAKYGTGRMRVDKVTGANTSLDINGGTVEIESKTLDSLPVTKGVYAHFDAEDPASLTCDVVGGVSNVTAWADVRGEGPVATIHETSTVRPKLRPQPSLGGKVVVDFGNASKKAGADADFTSSPSLLIPAKDRSERLHTVIALWGSTYGGGCLVGGSTGRDMDWSTRYTLARGGAANTYLGGQLTAGIVDSKMAIPYTCQLAKGVDFRLNGVATSHTALGVLKGGFDIATYAGYEAFGMGGFSGVFGSDVYYYGGEQFGEYVAFERKLAPEDVADIEAYLRKKWFGTETPGYGATALRGLSLGPDATLKVRGNAPVTVSGTLGFAGGEVDGAMVLASGVALEAAVDESGAVQGLTVSGGLDFPAAGTVTLVGALDALLPGDYTLLEAATPIVSAAGWSVSVTGTRKRYIYSLSVKNGKLMLNVSKLGMLLLVR